MSPALISRNPYTGRSTAQYSNPSNSLGGRESQQPDMSLFTGDPQFRANYERLYGTGGPLSMPRIIPRTQTVAPTAPAPTMPDIPPAMMQQIMASLAQRGFGASKGKPKLASKIAGDQWRSFVDQKSGSAYQSMLENYYRQRIGQPSHLAPESRNLANPEYVRALYEV